MGINKGNHYKERLKQVEEEIKATIRKKQFYKLKYLKQEKVKLEKSIQEMQISI